MADEVIPYNPKEESVVVYRTADDTLQLDVQLADETVWLSVQQIAALFGRDRSVISRHIRNIYNEHELHKNITCAKFAHMGTDGDQQYETTYYNLDVIISVGYRVKSQRGVEFRQWANHIIREYLLKGYVFNQQLMAFQRQIDSRFELQDRRLQEHTDQIRNLQDKVDFFVRTNMPPVEQVFFDGEFFEARVLLERLIKTATKRVIIIDAYIDAATFDMLDMRTRGVTADIYSDGEYKSLRDMHNASTGTQPICTHKWTTASHDRWLIIDDSLYHCGHSFKDLGKKLSAIMRMELNPDVILKQIN